MSPFTSNSEGTSLILDSLPMGVLFCDMDGVIRFVNKAYSDLPVSYTHLTLPTN